MTDSQISRSPPLLPGLAALAEQYAGFIIDVWGVLHDGKSPYPGAIRALEQLKASGKPALLLSNAPRPAHTVKKLFEAIGFDPAIVPPILTSGDAAREALATGRFGQKLAFIGMARDSALIEGLPMTQTGAEAADVIVAAGLDFTFDDQPENYRPLLETGITRKLPLICANPDLAVMHDGRKLWCAGALAALYRSMGGEVIEYGKPGPAIYEMALARLNAPGKVLCIGDGAKTDLRGAGAAGLDALFIAGGIHQAEIGTPAVPEKVMALFKAEDVSAVAMLEQFDW